LSSTVYRRTLTLNLEPRFPATGKSASDEQGFTVHTGKKDSKKKPYTGIEEFCHSYMGKDFKVIFKIQSEKTGDNAKKLVMQMITDLEREFATKPKNKRKPDESATLSSTAGFAATNAQPSTAASQVITIPTIVSRETDSHATQNWTQEQFVNNNFMKEPSIGTDDEGSGIE
jgi:hypothetical protein